MTTLITKAVITINKNYNCQEDANEYEQGIKMPGRTVTGESQHPQGGLGVLAPHDTSGTGGPRSCALLLRASSPIQGARGLLLCPGLFGCLNTGNTRGRQRKMRVCVCVSQLLLLSLARAEESPGMTVQPRVTTTVWFVRIRMSFFRALGARTCCSCHMLQWPNKSSCGEGSGGKQALQDHEGWRNADLPWCWGQLGLHPAGPVPPTSRCPPGGTTQGTSKVFDAG